MDRDSYLDDPSYIQGLPKDHLFLNNQNVFGFSLTAASLEVMQFLSMFVSPAGHAIPGAQLYHFIPGIMDIDETGCNPNCLYPTFIALGDAAPISCIGRDRRAEKAREERQKYQATFIYRISNWIGRFKGKLDH